MSKRHLLLYAAALGACLLFPAALSADILLEDYAAVLSNQDHLNSKGERLTEAAAIIRQDRANYHKFGRRDEGDENDEFFADAGNRAELEKLIKLGTSEEEALAAIVKGTPTIRVSIFRADDGSNYVNVSVIE